VVRSRYVTCSLLSRYPGSIIFWCREPQFAPLVFWDIFMSLASYNMLIQAKSTSVIVCPKSADTSSWFACLKVTPSIAPMKKKNPPIWNEALFLYRNKWWGGLEVGVVILALLSRASILANINYITSLNRTTHSSVDLRQMYITCLKKINRALGPTLPDNKDLAGAKR
jgi:hypothetical protein